MLFYNTIQTDYQEKNKEHSGRENNLAQGHTMMGVKMAMSSYGYVDFSCYGSSNGFRRD